MDGFLRRRVILVAILIAAAAGGARAQAPEAGPSNASITIVEFGDFSSEPGARLAFMIKALRDTYPNDVRVIFKHLSVAPNGTVPLAHEAALAAGAQGKFWEMADLLFANQQRTTRDDLIGMARQLGLDVTRFSADLESEGGGQFAGAIDNDKQEALKLGIKTPTCTLDDVVFRWPLTLEQLKAAVDKRLAKRVN